MLINRHNYEEYFILYMDNELSADERRMVEAFAAKHPDLKDELDSLLQYKLEPDSNIAYAGKDELMKVNGETPVTGSNYEEWLVSYADNELTNTQRAAVELFLAANPIAEKELALIQKSKLQPDAAVVFSDKSTLYRKEEKVRPLLPRWWRMAAAAILLIAAGLTTVLVVNNKKTGGDKIPVAKNTNSNNNIVPAPAISKTPEENNGPANVAAVNNNAAAVNNTPLPSDNRKDISPAVIVRTNNQALQKNIAPIPEKINPVNIPDQQKNNQTGIADNRPVNPGNNLPTPEQNPYYNNNKKKDEAIAKTDVPDEIKNLTTPLTKDVVTTGNPQPSDIAEPSFEENGKKNKLRGFFRKVARTFEKRTSIDATDGGDRLLIAGLSFKMK